jgi:DNA-binding MarR family transcriptional regulator
MSELAGANQVHSPAGAVPAPADAEREAAIESLRRAWVELLGAERRLRGRDQRSRVHGLTYAQLRALVSLADGERSAGELAKAADLNPASVTAMLDHLEQEGVLRRRRSEEDRRRCMVVLTPEGRELVGRMQAGWQARWREWLGSHSEADLSAAAGVMHDLTQLIESL